MAAVETLDTVVNGTLALVDLALLGAVFRFRGNPVLCCAVGAIVAVVVGGGVGAAVGSQAFAVLRGIAWALFAHGPVDLVLAAVLSFRAAPRQAVALVLSAVAVVGVAIDAFFVEPHAIEYRFEQITSPKVKEPLRIAVLADIQVDRVTQREWDLLEATMDEDPDIVLLAGDYIQVAEEDEAEYLLLAVEWKELIDKSLDAPLGVYAVRGNAEWRSDWSADLFEGLGFTSLRQTASVDLGPLVLTGLSFFDSFDPKVAVDGTDDFHVVLGHGPDFSLSPGVHADLLIAGHTHGGQVQLPFFGPLVTYSQIPRSQGAGGLFALDAERWLLVSRGIGMERELAPRLRFLCKPEVVIVDVVPPGWDGTWPGEEP